MADAFCDPFVPCDNLDGRLLISTAIQGPPLAWDLGEVSFGSFTSTGVAARPYVDIRLHQTWTPKEACYGSIRSIFSLAPGETVQIAVSVRQLISFAHLVSSASSDSRSTQGTRTATDTGQEHAKESIADRAQKEMAQKALVEQKMRYAAAYGSIFEAIADVLLPGVGGAIVSAAEGVSKHVENTSTGTADGIRKAIDDARATVETIARSESQHTASDSTTTSQTTETIQSLKRMFSNPYRDRSLQLRFIPVFRHFEVRTWPASVTPGIALHVGAARAVQQSAVRVRDVLAEAPAQVDAAVLQRPLAHLLSGAQAMGVAGRDVAVRSAAAAAPAVANVTGALAWSEAGVREDSVLVPLAEANTAASGFALKGQARKSFLEAIAAISPERIGKLFPVTVQDVHLFMGTHIEAVAGGCVLTDLPPLPTPPDGDGG